MIGPDAAGSGTLGNPYSYNSFLEIGDGAIGGSLTVTAGGTVNDIGGSDVYVGWGNDSAITVSGTGSTWTAYGYFQLGLDGGNGTINVSDGGTISAAVFIIGDNLSSSGHVEVDGGTLKASSNIEIGRSGTGSLTLSNGGVLTVVYSSDKIMLGRNAAGNGTLNIGAAAGEAAAPAGTTNATRIETVDGTGKVVFNHTDTNYILGSAIIGSTSIEHYAGATILTGTNTLTGGTTISGGTLQIGNGGTSGSLSGDVTNNAALIFSRSDASTYSGNMSGTGSLTKSGAGVLTLTGTNTHSGSTTVEAGTLRAGSVGAFAANTAYAVKGGTLDLNGHDLTMSALSGTGGTVSLGSAGLTVNQSGSTTYGGVISGSGSLTKSGAGTLTLTGVNTHTGGTTVSDGKLVVNGGIGAVTLFGGSLGGSGTIGGLTASAGSTIAPGNSIGTLNVAGNVSFAAGSTYDVEVDAAGNSDRIDATGSVSIDGGATVRILAENGTDDGSGYAPSTTYTIITSDTGRSGMFGAVSEDFAFLDAALGYEAKAVTLTLTRNASSFASVGRTANQRAVANAVSSGVTGNGVFDAVVGLSADGARAAFDSLSGEIHASLPAMFLNDSARLRDTVTSRIHDAFAGFSEVPEIAFNGPVGMGDPGMGAGSGFNLSTWGSAYGAYSRLAGDRNAATLSRSTGGALIGLEATAWPRARFGVLAGLGQSQASISARASSADADSYTLGAYGGLRLADLGLTFGAAYSWHDVTSERAVAVGGLRDTLTADYWSRTAQVFGEVSYALETPWLQVSPFAGLALLHQQTDAFKERGSAALALTGDGSGQFLGSSTLGLRMSKTLATSDGVSAALNGTLGWRHAIGDLTPDQRLALSGLDPFTVQSVPLDRDTALVEAGLALTISDRTTLDLSYQGTFGKNARDHGANARVNIRF
ncbi:autotransporter domain-containing protein [uncultured Roseibium sp.]|uniref:autotransporter outer membrane beta-barrel domain-containing protein n=1 Tax=uncultured Roseibium sp. TaxID=1936171 RepID=UPI003216E5D0